MLAWKVRIYCFPFEAQLITAASKYCWLAQAVCQQVFKKLLTGYHKVQTILHERAHAFNRCSGRLQQVDSCFCSVSFKDSPKAAVYKYPASQALQQETLVRGEVFLCGRISKCKDSPKLQQHLGCSQTYSISHFRSAVASCLSGGPGASSE